MIVERLHEISDWFYREKGAKTFGVVVSPKTFCDLEKEITGKLAFIPMVDKERKCLRMRIAGLWVFPDTNCPDNVVVPFDRAFYKELFLSKSRVKKARIEMDLIPPLLDRLRPILKW